MNGPTLELIEGTTFGFDLTWSDSSGTPVDLTGCVARFAICPALSNRPLASCSTADGGIVLGGVAGTVSVSLVPGQTAGQYSEGWKGARYELRVEYAGGQVYSLLRGLAAMTPAVLE